ncbi:MAG: TolC family protein [bacterium]|nr:TolC family protein [bacterium]
MKKYLFKNLSTYISVFVIILFSAPAFSQEKLNLSEFITLIKKNHPFFKKEALTRQINKKEQKSLGGARDITLKASPYYQYSKPVADVGMDDYTPTKTSTVGFKVEAEKSLWITGGKVALGWEGSKMNYSMNDSFTGTSTNNNYYQHKITLSYIQPILKNFRSILERLEYDLKDFDIAISGLQAKENSEDFITSAASKFLEWTLLVEQKKIVHKRLKLARVSLNKNLRMRRANLVDRVDVLRARDEVKTVQQSIASIDMQLKAFRAELASIAGSGSGSAFNYIPEFSLYATTPVPDSKAAFDLLLQKSRILAILSQHKKKLIHAKKGFENAALPDLSVQISGSLRRGDKTFNNAVKTDKPEFYTGLVLSYPLGNNTAEGDLEKTELQLKQLSEEVNSVKRKLHAALARTVIQLKELKKILQLNREQIASTREKTREEQKLFTRGKNKYFYVIRSRDQEYGARLEYAQNAYNYQLLLVQYQALTDELVK